MSGFEVHEDFVNASIHHHYGKPLGKFIGLHAMALVGHRMDQNGTEYYLLQNWWKEKQCVEIDAEYLMRSGASINFIKTPQAKIPNFSVHFGTVFELELIDKPERHPYERFVAVAQIKTNFSEIFRKTMIGKCYKVIGAKVCKPEKSSELIKTG